MKRNEMAIMILHLIFIEIPVQIIRHIFAHY